MITDGEDTMGGLDGATGNGYGPDYYHSGTFYPDGYPGIPIRVRSPGKRGHPGSREPDDANPTVKLFTVGVGISEPRRT